MRRNGIIVALTVLLVAAFAVTGAFAAVPKKGGRYDGTLFAGSLVALEKKVRVIVSPTGTSARVIWGCADRNPKNTIQFKINPDGSFKGYSNVKTLTVWSFVGRFVSPTKIRAALRPTATCDGKGGNVNLVLTP